MNRRAKQTLVELGAALGALLALSACKSSEDADFHSRKDTAPTAAPGAGSAAAPVEEVGDVFVPASTNAAHVSGYVADAEFAAATGPTPVTGTNLLGRTAVFEAVSVDAAGTFVRTAAARADLDGAHFTAAGLPGDALLLVTVDGHEGVLPTLGGAGVGVVLNPASHLASTLLQKCAAASDCAALVRAQAIDVNGLNELGALARVAAGRDPKAGSPEAVERLAAAFGAGARQTVDALKAKGVDEAGYATRVREAFTFSSSTDAVDNAVGAGAYDPRVFAKTGGAAAQLGTVAAVFAALGQDLAGLAVTGAVVREYVYTQAADEVDALPADDPTETKAAFLAKLRLAVDALSLAALARQVNGTLTPSEAAAELAKAAESPSPQVGRPVVPTDNRAGPGPASSATAHHFFVTSQVFHGDLGGLAPDAVCSGAAGAAGLPGTGWKAVLAYGIAGAVRDHIVIKGPVFDTLDQVLIADPATAFSALSLAVAPQFDENKQSVLGLTPEIHLVWTGSFKAGDAAPDTCRNWSAAVTGAPTDAGSVGTVRVGPNDDYWLRASVGTLSCASLAHVYCIDNQP